MGKTEEESKLKRRLVVGQFENVSFALLGIRSQPKE